MRFLPILLAAGLFAGCAERPAADGLVQTRADLAQPRHGGGEVSGSWILSRDGLACQLSLFDLVAEPRAGSLPPDPMYGARQEGDCGLIQRIWGWRLTAAGNLELTDGYGRAITTLRPAGDGFAAGGLTLRRG